MPIRFTVVSVPALRRRTQHVQRFAFTQACTFVLRAHQGADDVLPRRGPPLLDDRSKIGVKSLGGRSASLTFAPTDRRFQQTRALRRPHCESGSVFSRNAQHLGHDDHRQGPGDRLHEIERGWVVDVVQQGPQNAADAGLKRVDCSRGEGFADKRPQPRVVRRIQKQQREFVRRGQHGPLSRR